MFILEGQLKDASFIRECWAITPPAGAKLEDVLKPEYWTHAAKKLRVGAHIEAMPEDSAWFAHLIVRANTKSGVKVAVLSHVAFDAEEKPAAKKPAARGEQVGDFEVKFAGADKWRVTRVSDGEVMANKLASKDEALDWIEREATAMA